MHISPLRIAAAPLAALTIAGALPQAAMAQAEEPWKFNASLYGWFPSLGGDIQFPAGSVNIDVSTGDVLDALKFTLMGSFEARKGKWGVFTDLIYSDFGSSKSKSRAFTIPGYPLPGDVNADLKLDLTTWIWTLTGLYNLAETPDHTVDLLFGTRYLDLSNQLSWNFNGDISGIPLPGRTGSANADLKNWDAIVGVKGRFMFGDQRRWFVPYYLDVGSGESSLTWQILGGVGYRFDWGSVVASWRYLDYDFKSNSSLNMSGPVIGVNFSW